MRTISRTTLTALITLSAPLALHAQVAGPYDVFVFNNFVYDHSEVNGRLAVGGNADLTHWGVGRFLPADFSDYSLAVQGNLTATEGSVFAGRTYVGGTYSGTNTGFPDAYPPQVGGPSPYDFAAAQARLVALSNSYAAMLPEGTTVLTQADFLNFIGNGSTNVFDVSIEQLQNAPAGYEFVTPKGSVNIVNVLGMSDQSAFYNSSYYFDCTQVSDASSCVTGTNEDTPDDAGGVVWNFNTQSAVNIGGPVHGSILAPNSDVTFGVGDVVGSVAVRNASGNAEFYDNRDFQAISNAEAPEPATLVLMATGLAGVGFVRRRRRPRS